MAPAVGVLVLRVSVVVSVVLVQTLPVRVLVQVLASGALLGYGPGVPALLCSGAGAVALVVARHLGSSSAVARHGWNLQWERHV